MNTPTTAAGNAMRARFEAAMTAQGWAISRDADTGLYLKNEVQDRWEGWQAALSPGNASPAEPQGLREAWLNLRDNSFGHGQQPDLVCVDRECWNVFRGQIEAALSPCASAQPAPSPAREEGATPETDAEIERLYARAEDQREVADGLEVFARRLERERTTARQQLGANKQGKIWRTNHENQM